MPNGRVPSGQVSFEGCVEGCGEDASEGLEVSSLDGLLISATVGFDVETKYGVQSMDEPKPGSDGEVLD